MTATAAICVMAYNRPAYFQRCMRSVMSNKEAATWPIHVFIDGPDHREQKIQREVVDELCPESATVHQYDMNVGCGVNAYIARKILFDDMGFERVFFIEDDFVITPEYIGLVTALLDYCEMRYTDVGVAQAYWPCRNSYEWKQAHLRDITVGNPHWWGYLMSAHAWQALRDNLAEYVVGFLTDRPYHARDEMAIRRWASARLKAWDQRYRGDKPFPFTWPDHINYWTRIQHPLPASGQDGMTALSLQLAGYKKVSTLVNRGVSIGERGIHTSPETWKARGMDAFRLISFFGDDCITDFHEVQP